MNIQIEKVNRREIFYKKQFTVKQLLDGLQEVQSRSDLKINQDRLFSFADFDFLRKLFFNSDKDFILTSVLDYISENRLCGFGYSNTASLRRVIFFQNFLINKGNATKAAISAGYSFRSAKQQGHRVLRWIQKQNLN